MKKKYIIGIDGGTQSSKVVIFDLQGNIVCQAKESLKPMHMPSPGVAEHPDDDLWDSIAIASKKALAKFEGELDDIIGMGLCTIRGCRALLKADGTLVSPVISWMDKRCYSPYQHEDSSVKYVTTSSGYIMCRFTGEFVDTASNLNGQWPIDKVNWKWSDDPKELEKFNIPREMLFDIDVPGAIAGYVTEAASEKTGIPAGIPVVVTSNDKAVEALGAGLQPGNTALVSLGTYIGSMVYGDRYTEEPKTYFSNMACLPYHYLYESYGIYRGMWMVSWYKSLLGDDVIAKAKEQGVSPEDIINSEAEKVPVGSDGLMTVLDWLTSTDTPYKKGMMIGFDGRHTRAHIYRSILEAIAMTMRNHTYAMRDELEMNIDNVIISGGGSNSDLFMQIFADVYGIPAVRNVVNESASLGSAICVALALGVYDSHKSAIQKMVKKKDIFQPIKENTERYNRMNDEVYKNITEYTDELLKKSYPIFG